MTIGKILRKVSGKYFHLFGKPYRSFFVNLSSVAKSILPQIPQGATIVDVGGGDGDPLNYILSQRDDIKIKMIDPNHSIGRFIKKEHRAKVDLYPETSLQEFSLKVKCKPDIILIIDVIHHIPIKSRTDFLNQLKSIVDSEKEVKIIIKDVEPGYLRSSLGLIMDRYISGDKEVSLLSRIDIRNLMLKTFGESLVCEETNLFKLDKPNYVLSFVCRPIL